jgi:hypothetical protein
MSRHFVRAGARTEEGYAAVLLSMQRALEDILEEDRRFDAVSCFGKMQVSLCWRLVTVDECCVGSAELLAVIKCRPASLVRRLRECY